MYTVLHSAWVHEDTHIPTGQSMQQWQSLHDHCTAELSSYHMRHVVHVRELRQRACNALVGLDSMRHPVSNSVAVVNSSMLYSGVASRKALTRCNSHGYQIWACRTHIT